jgi:hypothetical protein
MKYGASTLRFPHTKDFRRNLDTRCQKVSPGLSWAHKKCLKNMGLEEGQIISLPGTPTQLGSALMDSPDFDAFPW